MAGSRDRDGIDDTMPASGPPEDEHGRPMRSSIPPVTTPARERYKLGAELGRGGMGRVVEAYDTQLGRTVALKEVLPKGASVARRFMREIQITARLEHPAIVPLYDAGTTPDGRPYYVMRRVTGRPLDEMIKRAPNLGERLALLPALLAAIDAVAHAHRRGVIHRDLKPANILVGDLGETVVIDWGLAKVVGERDSDDGDMIAMPDAGDSLKTQAGSVFGTPGFMPPEQARGEELGTSGDVYALGATLYQLLAGAPPHGGNSATEMLERTLKNDYEPLAERAPGAPPELVTIVEKALSSEPETRYANAGALGEDVRRFTTGQLVRAHSYTRRQRLGRFAKRHRAALIIAAAASVVLAVLAWVSVSRVMTERDHATAAQRAAETEKAAAESARDRLAERNAALVVTQARAELETNPTRALATLKLLDPTSSRLPEAKSVAQAAVMRGVWFAIRSTDSVTLVTELSLDGRLLLQISLENQNTTRMLRIWDLDRRRLVLARSYSDHARALWLAGDKVFVYDDVKPPELLDAADGSVTATKLPAMADAVADGRGRLVLGRDPAKHAVLWDAVSGAVTSLWDGHEIKDSAIAPDGSWLALGDGKELVVMDAAGKVIGTRAGQVTRLVVSDHRQIGVLDGPRVQVATVAAPMAWKDVELKATRGEIVLDLVFRGDELDMYLSSGDIVGYRSYVFTRRTGVKQFTYRLMEAGDHVLVVPSMDGKVYLISDQFDLQAPLPEAVTYLRVASRVGVSRFAVIGTGVILTFDLDVVTPRQLPIAIGEQALFADDDTVLGWRSTSEDWEWIDLRTRKVTPLTYDQVGIPMPIDIDPVGGRVLVRDEFGKSRLTLLKKGASKPAVIATGGDSLWGRLIAGNATLFGGGDDGRVLAKIGDEEPREVVKLDGHVIGVASLGALTFAALSDRGELVRGNLANGALERTNIPPPDRGFLIADLLGRVLVVADNKLLAWDKDRLIELHVYDRKNIARVAPTEAGLVVTLADNEMELLDPTGKAASQRLFTTATQAPQTQRSGRLVVGTGTGEQLLVLELPSLTRWTVPQLFVADQSSLEIAPNGRRVLQLSGSRVLVWDLPAAGQDFVGWLDEQTNALVQNDLLTWPWETK